MPCRAAGALAVDDSDEDEGPPIDIRQAAGLPMMLGESQADYANRILGSIGAAAAPAGADGSDSDAGGGGDSPGYDPMPNDSEVAGGDVSLEPLPVPTLLKKARVRPNPAVSVIALTIICALFCVSANAPFHCALGVAQTVLSSVANWKKASASLGSWVAVAGHLPIGGATCVRCRVPAAATELCDNCGPLCSDCSMALHDSMGMLLHSRYCFPAYEGRRWRELLRPGECAKSGMCPHNAVLPVCVLLHLHNTR